MDSNSFHSSDDGGSNSSSDARDGPLYHMNSLISSLPFKRSLSTFYSGKSQSFSCLADVERGEQLPKRKDSSHNRRKKLKGILSSASAILKRSQRPPKMMVGKKAMSFVVSCRPPV